MQTDGTKRADWLRDHKSDAVTRARGLAENKKTEQGRLLGAASDAIDSTRILP